LIGDAAGLAYAQSGEGIRPAIESALLAASVIQNNGHYSKQSLAAYAEQIMRRFGERQPIPGLLEKLPLAVRQFLGNRLLSSHWFARHIVMDRWFLHRQQAPLLPDQAA